MRTLRWTFIVFACLVGIWLSVLLWMTREAVIPGSYSAQGSWGSSTLVLRPDHTFVQETKFLGASAPMKINGIWTTDGRSLLNQNLTLKPFVLLGPYHRGRIVEVMGTSFGPVLLTGLGIEVDTGANIVYRK